jgi:hypothetical protein
MMTAGPPNSARPARSDTGVFKSMMGIDLGCCVLVAMSIDRPRPAMALEGVVREVVAPGRIARTPRVLAVRPRLVPVVRYVVQCNHGRLLRAETQMVVVCP